MAPSGDGVVVNKQELADALTVSKPTLDALLRRYPTLPVIRRGSNGEPWQFDLPAVIAFIRAQKADEQASTARRSDLLAQFALPIDAATPDLDPALTPQQRLALARARLAERDIAMKSGLLVPTAEVRQALEAAFTRLQSDQRNLLRNIAREHDWPDAVLRHHEAELADMQRRFVAQAAHYLTDRADAYGHLRLA